MFSDWDQFDGGNCILNTFLGFQKKSEKYFFISYLIGFAFKIAFRKKKRIKIRLQTAEITPWPICHPLTCSKSDEMSRFSYSRAPHKTWLFS